MTYALSLLLVAALSGAAGCWVCRRWCATKVGSHPLLDPLTSLPNQAASLEALTRSLSLADRLHHAVTVLLVEIDGFGQMRGHGSGAATEAQVATWLKQRVRAHDLLGHWAPGQFLVVLPDADVASALVLAEDMRQEGLRRTQSSGPNARHGSVSIGVHGRTPSAHVPLRDMAPDMVVGALRALEATTGEGAARIEIEP